LLKFGARVHLVDEAVRLYLSIDINKMYIYIYIYIYI